MQPALDIRSDSAPRSTVAGSGREPVVDVRALTKHYADGTEAVRGIDLHVGRGEVVGMLGPNGAGKTSTVEVLTGFRTRTSGSVQVLGLDPAVPGELRELRRRVGIVLQQTGHYRYLSARETIAMHRAYHRDPRGVEEVLELVGLTASADRRVRELSGGQQRRLDVAVALVGRPELIFLDEPTTGFDPAARRRAWDLVASLTELGTTVVLTTHYMEEAAVLADRLVVLREGVVVADGTIDEITGSLDLGTRITCTLPAGTTLVDLPPSLAAIGTTVDLVRGAPVLGLTTHDATGALAELCGWARERGIELGSLGAAPPTLEAAYLHLTGGADEAEEVAE